MQKTRAYTVTNGTGDPFTIVITGRVNWAMEQLLAAGEKGCTPIARPAPRWSDDVFKLRGEGVDIETVTEKHVGEFPGHHSRYVLRSKVVPGRDLGGEVAA